MTLHFTQNNVKLFLIDGIGKGNFMDESKVNPINLEAGRQTLTPEGKIAASAKQVSRRQPVFSGAPGSKIGSHRPLSSDRQAEIEHISFTDTQENEFKEIVESMNGNRGSLHPIRRFFAWINYLTNFSSADIELTRDAVKVTTFEYCGNKYFSEIKDKQAFLTYAFRYVRSFGEKVNESTDVVTEWDDEQSEQEAIQNTKHLLHFCRGYFASNTGEAAKLKPIIKREIENSGLSKDPEIKAMLGDITEESKGLTVYDLIKSKRSFGEETY
ncbi:MAG: hypothetical protein LBS87_01030 [Puniceicoccales bacterium]|nr:hypothetical protein [Puniceicoccales bacterium]